MAGKKTNLVLPWLIFSLFLSLFSEIQAEISCGYEYMDTLSYESFSTGMPDEWENESFQAGLNWKVADGDFYSFHNPGNGNWAFVEEDPTKNLRKAILNTSEYHLTARRQRLLISFVINFQAFEDEGIITLQMITKDGIYTIFEQKEDLTGRVAIELASVDQGDISFRFNYGDEDTRAWGVGIDEWTILSRALECGNGVCEWGESPETCPGDCEVKTQDVGIWIESGETVEHRENSANRWKKITACDDCSKQIELGFEVDFYGEKYGRLWLNSNGNVSFGDQVLNYTPEPFCLDGLSVIAPFFADIDLEKGGELSWYLDPDGHFFIASWDDVGYFGCDFDCELRNSFQLILTDGTVRELDGKLIPFGTNVIFNYQDMQWSTGEASLGKNGFGGKPATVGINKGTDDQCGDYGCFMRNDYSYYSDQLLSHCLGSGVNHLDYRSLYFQTGDGKITSYKGLVSFSGKAEKSGNRLLWELDNVDSVLYFGLERGIDTTQLLEFETVQLHSSGADTAWAYSLLDTEPIATGSWYRLIRYLENGNVEYSAPIKIELDDSMDAQREFVLIHAGPNPIAESLSISFYAPISGTYRYFLTDMAGRQHLSGEIRAEKGENRTQINLPKLSSGMYGFTLLYSEGKTYINLVKQ